jgi:transposase InsO family protein
MTWKGLYHEIREKLKPQLRHERRKDVRIRAELILETLRIGKVSAAAKRNGFGRGLFYKWWKRLEASGFKVSALVEQSRRPKRSPRRIDGLIETRIAFYRRKGFGPDIVKEYLRREGKNVAKSTITHVINKRKKPVIRRKSKLKKHRRRYELPLPGERLQIDVKYSPMKVEGKTVYIYVAVDECTRWRFARAYAELNAHWTIDFLDRLERVLPFPVYAMQTDNGYEFTYKLLNGSTHPMDEWCSARGIRHRLIPPGVKELNGKVERSHRIDADYFYGRAPTGSLELFNAALARWIDRYNAERPHGGIGFMTPIEKLQERFLVLREAVWKGTQEARRQRFVEELPKRTTKLGRQLLSLEKELARYHTDLAS